MAETTVFSITKDTENRNLNREDNPKLPDPFIGGMLYLFKTSPYSLSLQLRSSTDKSVQIRTMKLKYGEAWDLAQALLELAGHLQKE
jgi:hypothetical protein